jgi:hypothetical protein
MDFLGCFVIAWKMEGFFAKSPNSWLRATYAAERSGVSKGQQTLRKEILRPLFPFFLLT